MYPKGIRKRGRRLTALIEAVAWKHAMKI